MKRLLPVMVVACRPCAVASYALVSWCAMDAHTCLPPCKVPSSRITMMSDSTASCVSDMRETRRLPKLMKPAASIDVIGSLKDVGSALGSGVEAASAGFSVVARALKGAKDSFYSSGDELGRKVSIDDLDLNDELFRLEIAKKLTRKRNSFFDVIGRGLNGLRYGFVGLKDTIYVSIDAVDDVVMKGNQLRSKVLGGGVEKAAPRPIGIVEDFQFVPGAYGGFTDVEILGGPSPPSAGPLEAVAAIKDATYATAESITALATAAVATPAAIGRTAEDITYSVKETAATVSATIDGIAQTPRKLSDSYTSTVESISYQIEQTKLTYQELRYVLSGQKSRDLAEKKRLEQQDKLLAQLKKDEEKKRIESVFSTAKAVGDATANTGKLVITTTKATVGAAKTIVSLPDLALRFLLSPIYEYDQMTNRVATAVMQENIAAERARKESEERAKEEKRAKEAAGPAMAAAAINVDVATMDGAATTATAAVPAAAGGVEADATVAASPLAASSVDVPLSTLSAASAICDVVEESTGAEGDGREETEKEVGEQPENANMSPKWRRLRLRPWRKRQNSQKAEA